MGLDLVRALEMVKRVEALVEEDVGCSVGDVEGPVLYARDSPGDGA